MSSHRRKLVLGFALANLALIAIAVLVWTNRPATPPLIQGVLLPEGRELAPFSLIDHRNQPFANSDLLGQWHLVSYGFTSCPDVCPTTLAVLADVTEQLEANETEALSVLFYTVDHRRDTATQLASYMPFFNDEFIGLTHLDDSENPHLPFEQGLGIHARLTPSEEIVDGNFTNDYQVSHGITLFLINPGGQLQAIFEPGEDKNGAKVFEARQIYSDYLQIRRYFQQGNSA